MYLSLSLYIYIYIYIYVCVCVCVCLCEYVCVNFFTNPGSNSEKNSWCMATYFPSHKPSK